MSVLFVCHFWKKCFYNDCVTINKTQKSTQKNCLSRMIRMTKGTWATGIHKKRNEWVFFTQNIFVVYEILFYTISNQKIVHLTIKLEWDFFSRKMVYLCVSQWFFFSFFCHISLLPVIFFFTPTQNCKKLCFLIDYEFLVLCHLILLPGPKKPNDFLVFLC